MDLNLTHLLLHKNDPMNCIGFEANCDNLAQDDGCKLVLGLGPTPTPYLADYSSGFAKNREPENKFCHRFVSGADPVMLQLGLGIPIIDEGSSSAKVNSGGYMPSLLFAPRAEESTNPELSATNDSSFGSHHHHHPKKCRVNDCSKGARGASGLCIAHGGGHRCQKPNCNKGAESRTVYCKAHGGGLRCQYLGCTKSAEGKTDLCIAHGGGHRCGHLLGCTKAARGRSGLCIRHGGGKRCTVDGCERSAEGLAGHCISHGGGRRCQFPDCGKGAQGSTMFCKAHGGGKRCVFIGCTKGAEGSTPLCKGHGGGKRCLFEGGGVCPKSVHGGTDYCVAHGGGKRCSVPGCTKSARGRTDCCVRHGGGKRCRFELCGKSAQGSTDFCKAHGGGKRCRFAGGCEKFMRGQSGLCAAHASLMMMSSSKESNGGMISSGIFRGIVTSISRSSSGISTVSDCVESGENLIPPQVLVPLEMKDSFREGVIPEGRVHRGGLMELFGGDIMNARVFED